MDVKAKYFIFMFVIAMAFSVHGQEGYRIEVNVEGLRDTTTFLGYHLGDRQFIRDTADVDARGQFVFSGQERLPAGMYMVILPGNVYFEIIVDHNQHFGISTQKESLVYDLHFEQSPDNTSFYAYIRFLQQANHQMALLRQQFEATETDDDKRNELNAKIIETEQSVTDKQNQYLEDFPDGLFSRILLAQRPPDLSELEELALQQDDPNFMYQAYKKRYWDHIDFSDDRILRTPVYHAMLHRYINQFVMQIPDTIIVAADGLLEKARADREIFRYTLWYLTNNAERSQIMGMDAVFVHLVENYYDKGEAFWMTGEALERVSSRARQMAPLLIGRKAPAITGLDMNGRRIALYDIQANYLVLYFWESECAHCKMETPILKEIYEKYRDSGLDVFAMNVETDPDKWEKSVERYGASWINVNDIYNRSGFREKYDVYGIPLIYLLDRDKKIIAKKITAEQIDGFMQFEMNRNREEE